MGVPRLVNYATAVKHSQTLRAPEAPEKEDASPRVRALIVGTNMPIEAIAARAGVCPRTIYRKFPVGRLRAGGKRASSPRKIIDEVAARRLLAEGRLTVDQICAQLGVSARTLRRRMCVRSTHPPHRIERKHFDATEARRLLADPTLEVTDVARHLHVSTRTLRRYLPVREIRRGRRAETRPHIEDLARRARLHRKNKNNRCRTAASG